MKNIFNNPKYYIEQIKNISIPNSKRKNFSSKSLLCLWLTRLCPAHCENCFFKSNMYHDDIPDEKYQFSQFGIDRLIKFINESNNSYLMLSGGGEPMVRNDFVNELIQKVKTDRIVIVTNAIWAKDYTKAKEIIDELYNSLINRNDNLTVILRVSVDSFHTKAIGLDAIYNIINIFKEKYHNCDNFQLQFHTLQDDDTLENITNNIENCKITYSNLESVSDNSKIVKIMPKQATFSIDNYEIKVGIAKLFFSNLLVDLTEYTSDIQTAINIFEKDINESEYGNPSVLTNCDGSLGLDLWIDYNGNITTWGNQQLDNLFNVYVDNYKDFVNGILNNIISYSFLDKGFYYREKIIRKINPHAVLRSKAINLRDYASAFLLEEDSTKLYYAIHVIKDYLNEGILTREDISILPANLLDIVDLEINDITKLYIDSNYDIVCQYLDNKSIFNNKLDWEILFVLIRLGHYNVSQNNIQKAIEYYNETFYCNINSINDINIVEDTFLYEKLRSRISFMKKEAVELCVKMQY